MKKIQTKQLDIIFLDFDDIKNPLLAAGQAKATLEVGTRLTSLGHRLRVISSRYPGYKDRKEHGIEYIHIGLGTNNIRLNNFAYIFALPFTVMRLKADIIVECFTAPISTLFSPLFTQIPVVALPSSFDAQRFSELYHFPFWRVEKFGLQFYKYFVPFSAYFDKKMKKENKKVISRIIPEGVGNEFFAIKKQKPKHILFLGRLDINQKGIDLLLEAYKKVEKTIQYPLVIAGNGPDEEKVRKYITKLGLEKKVTMIGATYGKKKERVLSQSLFVAFSSRQETFSCFALEALASGLPLAAFDIPGLSWTDDSVVFKSKVFDTDVYAELLLKTTKRLTKGSMAVKTRKFARQFSWHSVVSDFVSFFTEILQLEKAIATEKQLTRERKVAYVS